MDSLIYVVIVLLVFFVLCWLGWYVVTHLPADMQPPARVIFVVLAVIVLLILLLHYGLPLIPASPHHPLVR